MSGHRVTRRASRASGPSGAFRVSEEEKQARAVEAELVDDAMKDLRFEYDQTLREMDSIADHTRFYGVTQQQQQQARDWYEARLRQYRIEITAQNLMEQDLEDRYRRHREMIRRAPPPMRTAQEVLDRRNTFLPQAARLLAEADAREALYRERQTIAWMMANPDRNDRERWQISDEDVIAEMQRQAQARLQAPQPQLPQCVVM